MTFGALSFQPELRDEVFNGMNTQGTGTHFCGMIELSITSYKE